MIRDAAWGEPRRSLPVARQIRFAPEVEAAQPVDREWDKLHRRLLGSIVDAAERRSPLTLLTNVSYTMAQGLQMRSMQAQAEIHKHAKGAPRVLVKRPTE